MLARATAELRNGSGRGRSELAGEVKGALADDGAQGAECFSTDFRLSFRRQARGRRDVREGIHLGRSKGEIAEDEPRLVRGAAPGGDQGIEHLRRTSDRQGACPLDHAEGGLPVQRQDQMLHG